MIFATFGSVFFKWVVSAFPVLIHARLHRWAWSFFFFPEQNHTDNANCMLIVQINDNTFWMQRMDANHVR